MASKPKTQASKKKQPAAIETSQSIQEQTAAFLQAGGKIETISRGVSGQSVTGGARQKPSESKALKR